MIPITLTVEVAAGASIEEVCRYAVGAAIATGIVIRFTFNGITLYADPDSIPDKLIAQYSKCYNRLVQDEKAKQKGGEDL